MKDDSSEKRFRKPWLQCVGSDRVSSMLRSEYWERFRELQRVLPVKYIRCHGLLGDELGLVRRSEWEGRSALSYNYAYLDQIFDTMLANNVRPFVEWGFMPKDLASGGQAVF
jgi:xylan 1,4-beta-xylosidase